MECKCGCGAETRGTNKYIMYHNLKTHVRSPEQIERMAEGNRRAWLTRPRLPVGTRHVSSKGYVMVKTEEGAGRWDREHIVVVEKALKRKLTPEEVVHHINGDRGDNRPENLLVCRDRSHHNDIHRSQDEALRALLNVGLVVFVKDHYEARIPMWLTPVDGATIQVRL